MKESARVGPQCAGVSRSLGAPGAPQDTSGSWNGIRVVDSSVLGLDEARIQSVRKRVQKLTSGAGSGSFRRLLGLGACRGTKKGGRLAGRVAVGLLFGLFFF